MSSEHVLTRRGVLKAGLGGLGAAALPSPQGAAAAMSPVGGLAASAGTRIREFTAGTNASVIVSPDGHQLIMEVQGVLWSLPREGGAATALTRPDLEPAGTAWSPDGSRIAVCGYQGGGFHLWTMRPDGSQLRQLTSGPWDDRGVAWSPDGTRIAFASERGGDPVAGSSYSIWTVDVRSGALTRLTNQTGAEDYDPAWYPDGSKLVFVRAGATGARTLASVPAEGGEATVLRTVDTGVLVGPAVGTDGRVAYVHLGDAVLPANAGSSTLLVDGEPVTDGEDVSPLPPCWGADGQLFYVADGQLRVRRPDRLDSQHASERIPFTAALGVPALSYTEKTYEFDSTAERPVRGIHLPVLSPDGASVAFAALNALWVMPIGRRPRRLVQADASGYVQMPSWAPDGRSVLYSYDGRPNGNGLISVHRYWLDEDRDETVASGGRLNATLSPDGTRLACQDSSGSLLVKDLATGTERVLVKPLGANGLPSRPTWSPDGRYVAFCDRNRLNQRFREGYNLIRVVDTGTGEWTAHQPLPHASLSDRGNAGPVWAPDGSAMAFVMESALWVLPVHANGSPAGAPLRITDEAADHPSWSEDSQTLLYLAAGTLKLVGRDGTRTRTLSVPLQYNRRLPSASDVTRVHAGRLWDGTGDTVLEDVDIVIRGNRVASVEPHRAQVPSGETLVDASTSTIIPGLWDSHTHPWQYTYGGRQSSLMLAYGVTTNVSLGGFAHEAVRIRESVQSGHMAGPRLFATGELIDGSRVAYSMGRAHRTRDGVRRSLERATALDYDFVKTYVRACAETMREAARTAHEELGVRSGSHFLSPGVNVGQDLTTHLAATQRTEYGRAYSPTGHSYQDVLETYRHGDFELVFTPFTAIALLGADPALADDPRVTTLMPPWDTALVDHYAATPPTPAAQQAIVDEMAVYRRILEQGGTLALGTDAPLAPIGLHVHLGLRALRSHGFSAAQALRTATVVPARVFGVADDLGTVEPGKVADLTAVDGNPFEDFDDLIRTTWAMRDGIVHRQDDLVGSFATATGRQHRADTTDWLEVSRRLRREPCCAQHVFDI
ncbi:MULTISPECIES: amidohydrolase family protein [Streptomyces]|uniref:amidohydrolase family protein n=1 Tax=Streptomyces TaxID=1883 RepID=UPI0023DD3F41|nr:amidohydrolase family protein [Streptomyces sp. FXJ1.172]WEP00578.1 amidohydrolase family protein [Streptomyces sp. FXJ1.172]